MELTHQFKNVVVKHDGHNVIFKEAMEANTYLDKLGLQISKCEYSLIMDDGEERQISPALFMKILVDEFEIYGHID